MAGTPASTSSLSPTGVLTNIAGAASANALFSNFDFDSYGPLASVYVPPGSTSVLGSHVAPKASSMPSNFIRTYDYSGTRSCTLTPSGRMFQVIAEGDHSWGVSKLKRLTNYAMEWSTSFWCEAADEALAVLILEGRASNAAAQKVLQMQNSGGTELAYINGEGQLYADNLKFGTGPQRRCRRAQGRHLHRAATTVGRATGIWQKGGADGDDGGLAVVPRLRPLRVVDADRHDHLLAGDDTRRTGSSSPSASGSTRQGPPPHLAAVIGSRYGSQSGQIKMPGPARVHARRRRRRSSASVPPSGRTHADHRPPAGARHNVNDPGHAHPQAGPYAYIMPWQYHNNRHPVPSDSALEHIYTEPAAFNKYAGTGITIGNTGSGKPISMYQPTHTVNLYVKL